MQVVPYRRVKGVTVSLGRSSWKHFVKCFRHFLEGRQFRLRTDHSSLRWLIKFKNPEGQLAKWLEVLSLYDMLIEHRPGAQHQTADALSRIPCKKCGFFSSWDQEEMPGTVNTITMSEEETKLSDNISLKSIQEKDADVTLFIKWMKA